MYPILFQSGNWIVPSWHFFLVLGICTAFTSVLSLASRYHRNVSGLDLRLLMAVIYIAGYVGARGLSVLMFGNEGASFWSFGRMTLYGGLLLGGLSGLLFAKLRRMPIQVLWNLAGIAILLGVGTGRIGCFLNGDDFGQTISFDSPFSFFGVSFPNLEDPENGIIRHPVQLYESFFTLGMGLFCFMRYDTIKKWFPRFGFALIGYYAAVRFVLEFFRADDRGELFSTFFSPSQEISLLVLMSLFVVYMFYSQPGKQDLG